MVSPAAMPRRTAPLTATPPRPRTPPAHDPEDLQLSASYWNHRCPASECGHWLPRHLPACQHHREAPAG